MEALNQSGGGAAGLSEESPWNRDLWQILLEKAWLIICIVVAAGAIGYYRAEKTPRVYQSRAVIFLDFGEQVVVKMDEVDKREKAGVDLLNTIANNIRSSSVLKRVVTAKNLTQHAYFKQWSGAPTEEMVVGMLSGSVDARLRRFTRLIDVTAEFGDPALAQLVAQAVIEEFIKQNNDERSGVGENAAQFLIDEEKRIKERLAKAERAVLEYRQTNNISLGGDNDILTSEFKALAEKCTEAKDERRLLELEAKLAVQVGDKLEELLKLPLVLRSPEVVALKEKVQAQETLLSNLLLRYKEKHPAMIQARNELASLKKLFEDEVRRGPDRLKKQYEAALEKERILDQALKEQEKKLFALDSLRGQFDVLQREAAADRRLYDNLIQRLREVNVTSGLKKNDIRIVEPAFLPVFPIRPNKRMIFTYSLGVGFAISLGMIFLLKQLDTTIKSVDQAEQMLSLPVLGAIPKNRLVRDGKGRLFISDDPQSLCAEAFRSLRASVALLGREADRKIVLFTSAVPSEGKSFCCVNYAVSYAQQGRRTLVIDFDLRKPALGETFGMKMDLPGVTDVLLGKNTLEKCALPTRFENLHYLPAGTMVPNPAELMSGQWTKKLLQEAASKYDHVVLDTAPINAVSDTLLFVHEAHTVCMVMRARKTPARVVARALEMLRRAGVRPSGVILNFLPTTAGPGYYYYYSGNKYYGHKGVYGAAPTPRA
jgi:polysaccharide biosynthesis transport protein